MVLEICYWTASLAEGWRIDFVREAKRRPRVDRPRKSRVNPPSGTLAGAIVAVSPLIKKCSAVPAGEDGLSSFARMPKEVTISVPRDLEWQKNSDCRHRYSFEQP